MFSGTLISTLPKTEVALITVSLWPKSASVRSISTLPNSANAFVRPPTRQRPLRVELLKIATRLSAGPVGSPEPYACDVPASALTDAPGVGRSRTSGSSSPTVLAR